MRTLQFITGHVIYNPAYAYKFQLKTTWVSLTAMSLYYSQVEIELLKREKEGWEYLFKVKIPMTKRKKNNGFFFYLSKKGMHLGHCKWNNKSQEIVA